MCLRANERASTVTIDVLCEQATLYDFFVFGCTKIFGIYSVFLVSNWVGKSPSILSHFIPLTTNSCSSCNKEKADSNLTWCKWKSLKLFLCGYARERVGKKMNLKLTVHLSLMLCHKRDAAHCVQQVLNRYTSKKGLKTPNVHWPLLSSAIILAQFG